MRFFGGTATSITLAGTPVSGPSIGLPGASDVTQPGSLALISAPQVPGASVAASPGSFALLINSNISLPSTPASALAGAMGTQRFEPKAAYVDAEDTWRARVSCCELCPPSAQAPPAINLAMPFKDLKRDLVYGQSSIRKHAGSKLISSLRSWPTTCRSRCSADCMRWRQVSPPAVLSRSSQPFR
jgi:hypothetical protein